MRQKAKFALPTRFNCFGVNRQYWRVVERHLIRKFENYADIRMINFDVKKANGKYIISFESEGRCFSNPSVIDEDTFCYINTFHHFAHECKSLFQSNLVLVFEDKNKLVRFYDTETRQEGVSSQSF